MTQEESVKRIKQLEMIVSLIPEDRGSVSVGFLIRLLSMAKILGASPVICTHLIKKCSLQLEEATINDLTLPLHESSGDNPIYDIELVEAVLKGFVTQWRKLYVSDEQSLNLIIKVGKLVDSYLQVISTGASMSVQKVMSLAKALPEFARPEHDKLYKAINIYLTEHPQMSKDDKKRLCSILDCWKLSAEACAHAIKNDRLPLRTVVQILFFEQGKHGGKATSRNESQQYQLQSQATKPTETRRDTQILLQQSSKADDAIRRSGPSSTSQMLESQQKSREKEVRKTGSDT
ncbi:BTB/POZ domain-containing protein isoform X1, partial [Tanacetum coccineum]